MSRACAGRGRRGAAVALALAACAPVTGRGPSSAALWIDDVARLRAAHRAKDAAGEGRALAAMHALAPNNLGVTLALAENAAARGDTATATSLLGAYVAADLTVPADERGNRDLAALLASPAAAAMSERLAASAAPRGDGRAAFALPTGDHLFEDVAWDARGRRFFVSSVRDQDVWIVDAAGKDAHPMGLPRTEGVGVAGVALAADGILWATQTPLPPVPGFRHGDESTKASALVAIDPATGRVVERVELPRDDMAHALTDVATGAGEVYVSDATGGGVYVLPAREHALRLVARLRSPQTPAPGPGGTLYVPDYSLGIARVAVRTGRASWLEASPTVDLSGIDGLYLVDGALVAVQNGTSPPRVVRLALSADGGTVTGARVLSASAPGLGEPTHGALVGDDLWFLAASGWSRFDDQGAPVHDPPPDAPAMWRVRVRP